MKQTIKIIPCLLLCVLLCVVIHLYNNKYRNIQGEDLMNYSSESNVVKSGPFEDTSRPKTTSNTISSDAYKVYGTDEGLGEFVPYTSDMQYLEPQNEDDVWISEDVLYEKCYPENQAYYDKYNLYQVEIGDNYSIEPSKSIPYRMFDIATDDGWYVLPPVVGYGNTDNFEYLIHKNRKIQLIKYIGTSREVVIPNEIQGQQVAYIGEYLFYDSNIKSVYLGENIKIIGASAFALCKELSCVILPENLLYICSGAFSNTDALKQVLLPNSLQIIGSEAFYYSGIEKITIPTSVNGIYTRAFFGCSYLKEVVLENGINNIESQAFADTSVEYLYIPSSLTKITDGTVFQNCSNLKRVEFAEMMNEETTVCASMFEYCNKLSEVKLPSNITAISGDAFRGCSSLKEIYIPGLVNEIGYGAFGECYFLTDIYFESSDCDGLDESGLIGQARTIHAPSGGNIEEFCNSQPLLKFAKRNNIGDGTMC